MLSRIEAARQQPDGDCGRPTIPASPIVPIRRLPKPKAGLLESTADADAYVEDLRRILHDSINSGKRISL